MKIVFKCYDCETELIITQFNDGVVRALCPTCRKKLFMKMGEYGLEKVKCYSQFETGA